MQKILSEVYQICPSTRVFVEAQPRMQYGCHAVTLYKRLREISRGIIGPEMHPPPKLTSAQRSLLRSKEAESAVLFAIAERLGLNTTVHSPDHIKLAQA